MKKEKLENEFSFSCDVDFLYPKSIEQFEDLLELFNLLSPMAKRNENDDDTLSFDDEILIIVIALEKN